MLLSQPGSEVLAIKKHPKFLVSFPSDTISRNYKISNKRRLWCVKELVQNVSLQVKCRIALWLEACEALWTNCKRTQSSKSRFFLCMEYELLLRSLRSKNM